MNVLKTIAWTIVIIYCVIIILLYILQTRLIFYPGVLSRGYRFKLGPGDEEVFLRTSDRQEINGIFFGNDSTDVILYFHGNAGDLSGWQFAAEDFTGLGYNFMIIDYRGYGKSSGTLSENGLYMDAEAAFDFLIQKGFTEKNILIYGRSIGSGIAVDLASKKECKGLILESPFTSLSKLAAEKLPFFFPSLYLKFRFNNLDKIRSVKCPVIFLHGSADSLIPADHSKKLFAHFTGRKKMIIIDRGAHNDLNSFKEYEEFLKDVLPSFFN